MLPTSPEPAAELTANPYRAPEAQVPRFYKVVDHYPVRGSPAEVMRFRHARTEGNLKALGIFLLLLGAAWVVQSQYYMSIAYLHVTGSVSAPWIAKPFSVASIAMNFLLGIAAIATGYGLLWRRGWSRGVGIFLVSFYVAYWLMLSGYGLRNESVENAVAGILFGPIWFIPMTILGRSDAGIVLSSEYAAAIEETPYIKVRPRLPRWIKLAMLLNLALLVGVVAVLTEVFGFPKT